PTRMFDRIDDPELAVVAAERREHVNHQAVSVGLPPVGASMISDYGIMWIVDNHLYAPTANTAKRCSNGELQPHDLYPAIVPQNLSSRLTRFIATVNRCTSKLTILLDTTPELRPFSVPGYHYINTLSDANANLVFLDA